MTSSERGFGYTGACGLIQALAVGYFVYDLIVSIVHVRMFGIGMLFHAISALWVFSLGFVSCLPNLPDIDTSSVKKINPIYAFFPFHFPQNSRHI